MNDETYFTPEELAEKFKVKKRTVYFWVRTGKLKAIKLASLLRIPKSSLDEFIKNAQEKE